MRISSRVRSLSMFSLVTLAAGCSADKTGQPPLSNVTSLSCPAPGALPFELQSWGVHDPDNTVTLQQNPRIKDEASDTIGNPGGAIASIYLSDKASPAPGNLDFAGFKQRTTPNQGFFDNPLPNEYVSLWSYGAPGAPTKWQMVGRTITDAMGAYDLPTNGFSSPNGQPIYAVLEADGSCAAHYDYLWPAGTKVVVFDIDGTLTLSDNEFLDQLSDGSYVPKLMGAGNTLVQAWAAKGYKVVYLTARAHDFRADTRAWLELEQFPLGPVITENSGDSAQPYKTLWMTRMVKTFGWDFVAAYGNMDTDIGAYAAVNIPLDATFIVGPFGGDGGTVAIPNLDYTDHINTYVAAQPAVKQ